MKDRLYELVFDETGGPTKERNLSIAANEGKEGLRQQYATPEGRRELRRIAGFVAYALIALG